MRSVTPDRLRPGVVPSRGPGTTGRSVTGWRTPGRRVSRIAGAAAVAAAGLLALTACTASPAPAPGPTPTVDPDVARAQAVLAGLDLRARAAQLVVVGLAPAELDQGVALVGQGVGGLFLEGRPTQSVPQLAVLTSSWAAAAGGAPKVWVAVDQEGGAVRSLHGAGFPNTPAAVDLAAEPDAPLSADAGALAAALQQAGVTLDLAPVVDVVPAGTERANAPIGFWGRQLGSEPAAVEHAAGLVLDALVAHDVQPTLKHFPGLGLVTENTDTSGPVRDAVTGADSPQLDVYRTLLAHDPTAFVMVSSATYPRIDPANPAMYSSAVVDGLLRGTLGFDGVVITDDVGKAVAAGMGRTPGERAVDAVRAGGTLVLTDVQTDLGPMVDALVAAAADEEFATRLDDAARVALAAKARAGLLGG